MQDGDLCLSYVNTSASSTWQSSNIYYYKIDVDYVAQFPKNQSITFQKTAGDRTPPA